ncbi:efflux RND transporter permease subunit [Zhongshania sp.]
MALSSGIGSEMLRTIATMVIGGILSSRLLTLFVLPTLCSMLRRTELEV